MELFTQSFNDDVKKVEVSMKEIKKTHDRLINTCKKHSELINQISQRNYDKVDINIIPPGSDVEPAQDEAQGTNAQLPAAGFTSEMKQVNPTLHPVQVLVPLQTPQQSQVVPNEGYPTVDVSSSLIKRSEFQQENSVLPAEKNNSSESLSSDSSVNSDRTARLIRKIK